MRTGRDFSRIISLSFCVILPLLLAEVPGKEPFGLHLDSDGKRIPLIESDVDPNHIQLSGSYPVNICNPLDVRSFISTVAMPSCSTVRPSVPVDAGSLSLPPDEGGSGSSTVLRV